jgi:acyl phosphate:glycerol-3-phosphate acyltransferase
LDVRAHGSGNVGATNVARTLGARLGLITLLADMSKGALPVAVAIAFGAAPGGAALTAAAAVIGHVFSVFQRFRGGKGVATASGSFLVLSPAATAIAALVFAVVVRRTRLVSLASLLAVGTLPVAVAVLKGFQPAFWLALFVAALIAATHRENLRRLTAGTEPRFRASDGSQPPPAA